MSKKVTTWQFEGHDHSVVPRHFKKISTEYEFVEAIQVNEDFIISDEPFGEIPGKPGDYVTKHGSRLEIVIQATFEAQYEWIDEKVMNKIIKRHIRDLLVASKLHDNWRKARKVGTNTEFEPRLKKTTDKVWAKAHGTDTCDIANTPFLLLPADWQAENLASAIVANDLIDAKVLDLETASAAIHVEWLKRNKAHAEQDQLLAYNDPNFPEAQRQLDRDVFNTALEAQKDE